MIFHSTDHAARKSGSLRRFRIGENGEGSRGFENRGKEHSATLCLAA